MKIRFVLLLAGCCLIASSVAAKTKITMSGTCKVAGQQQFEVGDKPNHWFGVSQAKCTYAKPAQIAGSQSKEGMGTAQDETTGNSSKSHEIFVETLASGDKVYYLYDGENTLKDGKLQSFVGKWRMTGGTGKAAGIKGQGTCKGSGNPDGSLKFDCEGVYAAAGSKK